MPDDPREETQFRERLRRADTAIYAWAERISPTVERSQFVLAMAIVIQLIVFCLMVVGSSYWFGLQAAAMGTFYLAGRLRGYKDPQDDEH